LYLKQQVLPAWQKAIGEDVRLLWWMVDLGMVKTGAAVKALGPSKGAFARVSIG